jgi:cytochrome c oxidase subunit 1
VLFQHFFWFYSHPAVYIMILPGMAIVNELIATFSRRKIFGYMFVAMSSVGLALLGFLVWGHHMFVAGMSEYATMVFSALTFLVAIPSGVKVFNWTATLYKGSISLESPMLYALAFIVLFTIGGLTGLFLGTLATDVHLHDTYFVVAHFHYVMVGGTVFGFLGGLHYWWPKMFGKMYDENWRAWRSFCVHRLQRDLLQPVRARLARHAASLLRLPASLPALHQVSTVGAYTLLAGFLVMAAMFWRSLTSGRKSPRNPWGSAGYEWQTESPPIEHNFHHQPVMERGPYDYHLATEAELFAGYDHEPGGIAHGGGRATGHAAPAAHDHEEEPARASGAATSGAKDEEE